MIASDHLAWQQIVVITILGVIPTYTSSNNNLDLFIPLVKSKYHCTYARLLNRFNMVRVLSCALIPIPLAMPNNATHSIVVIRLARPILVDFRQSIASIHLLFLRFAGRIEIRALSLSCDTYCMPAMWGKAKGRRMILSGISHCMHMKGRALLTHMRLSHKATSSFCHWKRTCIS